MANANTGDALPGAPDPRGVTAVDGTAKAGVQERTLGNHDGGATIATSITLQAPC